MDSLRSIEKLAEEFRAAIERADPIKLGITFKDFPSGSCGDTALLLSEYLSEHDVSPVNYVCGVRGEGSHGWLEFDEIIIDITADQFDDMDQAVIATRNRSWHETFERDTEGPADWGDEVFAGHLAGIYAEIRQHLP